MTDARAHSIQVELSEPPPPEVPAGTDVVIKAKVSCSEGCDLRGMPVKITASDGTVVESKLTAPDSKSDAAAEVTVRTPKQVGAHTYGLMVPAHEAGGIRHEEATL